MSSNNQLQQTQCYDLHVPLSSASTYPPKPSTTSTNNGNNSNSGSGSGSLLSTNSRKKRQQQSHMYQMRLHQLGYHGGVAFTHSTFGRLNPERDDADVTLPWGDLIPPSLQADTDGAGGHDDGDAGGHERATAISFGRTNSLGMKIYRRLNIIVEEVSDVSRILLPTAATTTSSQSSSSSDSAAISKLFQKYDIISLQPMNEPALQNICELLSSSPPTTTASFTTTTTTATTATTTTGPNNNNNDRNEKKQHQPPPPPPQIDILVLEYATGSRGGYGLPFKLRKEYLLKTLEAGVTFELCYGAAILDPKRRQGFLKSLLDFQTTYSSIQKKNLLLNKHIIHHHHHNSNSNNYNSGKNCKSDKFPILLSSGPRQNYSQGTDEGLLALRSYMDVKSLVYHLIGGDGWMEKGVGDAAADIDSMDDFDLDDADGDFDGKKNTNMAKKKKSMGSRKQVVMNAADKVVARARERRLGVITARRPIVNRDNGNGNNNKKRKRGFPGGADVRMYVRGFVQIERKSKSGGNRHSLGEEDEDEEGDEGGGNSAARVSTSLVDWLSEPMKTMPDTATETKNDDGMASSSQSGNVKRSLVEIVRGKVVRTEVPESNKKEENTKTIVEMKNNESDGDENDLEDGYIAL